MGTPLGIDEHERIHFFIVSVKQRNSIPVFRTRNLSPLTKNQIEVRGVLRFAEGPLNKVGGKGLILTENISPDFVAHLAAVRTWATLGNICFVPNHSGVFWEF